MFSLEELFCSIDDFCVLFEPGWQQQLIAQGKCRCRSRRFSRWTSLTPARSPW